MARPASRSPTPSPAPPRSKGPAAWRSWASACAWADGPQRPASTGRTAVRSGTCVAASWCFATPGDGVTKPNDTPQAPVDPTGDRGELETGLDAVTADERDEAPAAAPPATAPASAP